MTTPAPPGPPNGRGRRRVAVVAGAVAAAIAMAVLVVLFTAPGLRLAAMLAERALGPALDAEVRLDDLDGRLWGDVRIGSLSVDYPDGSNVAASALKIVWSPGRLLAGTLQIDSLRADRLVVRTSNEPDETTPADPATVFSLPVAVRLDRVAIAELVVTDPLDGASYTFSVEAALVLSGGADNVLEASVRPIDGAGDRLDFRAGYNRAANTLDLDAEAMLPVDGAFWRLAGTDPAWRRTVRLEARGNGPLDDWRGELRADADGIGSGSARVGATFAEPAAFDVDGSVDLDAAALPAEARTLAGRASFSASGRLADTERLDFDSVTVRKDGIASLSGRGALSLATLAFDARVTAEITGEAAEPLGPDVAWRSATLQLEATGEAGRVELTGDLRTDGVQWDEPMLANLVGPAPVAHLSARSTPDGAHLDIRDLRVDAARVTVTGAGRLSLADGRVSGADLTAELPELADVRDLRSVVSAGAATIRLADLTLSASGRLEADLAVTGRGIVPAVARLAMLVGPAPSLAGRLTVSPAGEVSLGDLTLRLANADMAGDAGLSAGGERLALTLDGRIIPAGLVVAEGIAVNDTVTLALSLDGPIARPRGRLWMSASGLAVHGTTVSDPVVEAGLGWTADDPEVTLAASAGVAGLAIEAGAILRAAPGELVVRDARVTAPGLRLAGDGRLPGYKLPAVADARLEEGDLAALGGLLAPGTALSGRATGDLALHAVGGRQTARLTAEVREMSLAAGGDAAPLTAARVTATADLTDVLTKPKGEASLAATDVARASITLRRVSLDAAGALDDATVTLSAEGTAPVAIHLDAAGHVALTDDALTAELARADGSVAGFALALDEPGRLSLGRGPDAPLDARLALRLAEGVARLDARRSAAAAAATLDLEGLRTGPVAALLGVPGQQGTLDGTASITEDASGAHGEASVTLADLAFAEAEDLPPARLTATARLADGRLAAEANLGVAGAGEAWVTADLPVDISLVEGRAAFPGGAPLTGEARARGELGSLWQLLPFPDHTLAGSAVLDVDLSGTVADPRIEGMLAIDDGRYEHLEFGTLLTGLTLDAGFAGRSITIRRLTASDGGDGRVSVAGTAGFDDAGGVFRYDVALNATGATVIRRDDVELQADAALRLTGEAAGGSLTGDVTVNRAEVDLGAVLPPSVPTLDVEVEGAVRDRTPTGVAADGRIALDTRIVIPGRAFVRGRGLDSEWRGELTVGATADEPRVFGTLTVQRGQLDVIGKTFVLKDSTIRFVGNTPPDPVLGIRGEYATSDLTVVALLSGPASAPELSLESTPVLPRDEVIARVLFGKSRDSLSPLEAAQLAKAVAELSGTSSGLDVLGSIRRFVGVDVLRIETGEAGPEVRAGKYIHENVYVGTKQGAAPGTSGVEVEVEITPNVSVSTETGQTGESDVGVQFKLDY